MNTTRIQVSKDRKFARSVCSCGWTSTPARSKAAAQAAGDLHLSSHRRTKVQIAADREALLEAVGTEWVLAERLEARESDLRALIASGALEAEVRESLPGRAWLAKGRLIRRHRYVRRTS